MPGTLRRTERTDSASSRDSAGLVRIRPLGGASTRRYTSNGSGVTRVNLNSPTSTSSRAARSLHNDTRVNRLTTGRVAEDRNLIEFVKPTGTSNRYVTPRNVARSAREVESGGESLRKAGSGPPSYQPATPPDQRRNHVWNIVNQFDRESKQRYVGQLSDDDGELSSRHSPWPHDSTDSHLDMNKPKKNPITNGIKVIFGLKSQKKSNSTDRGRNSPDTYNSGERVDKVLERSGVRTVHEENERNSTRHGNRLGLLKTATENSRRGQRKSHQDAMEEDRSELTVSRAMSPDQDVTDGYSTSKTFEYYDNDKGLDNYDSIRDYYLNKYRTDESARGTPELLSDYRPESPASPSPVYSSTQKTRLANGASEYVFRSHEGVNRTDDQHRSHDMYKSTGDLEYRNRQQSSYSDKYGGSQPDINRGRITGHEEPRGRYTSADLRSRGYVTTIVEDDIDRRSPYGSLEREGSPISRDARSPDSRFGSMERMRRAPAHVLEARPISREYGTLESGRYRRSNRAQSPESPEPIRRRYGSTSSIDSSHEKVRSWERRARERGRLQRIFTGDNEPTYSTIDKRNKVNRRLDFQNSKEQRGFSGRRSQSETIYRADVLSDDDQSTLRRNNSRQDYGYDTTGKYGTEIKHSVVRDARIDKLDQKQRQMQLERVDRRDRSSSAESVQRHVERSHNKQVMRDDDKGFDQTVEEENYKDVTMEKVETDSDTEEVVDVTKDSKTEEYEKDGHYHKQHKQSTKETKTFRYNLPDVVETLRNLSRPVENNNNKRISDRPYYHESGKDLRPVGNELADVKTSIEKSKDENRYREGNRDIHDRQANNRAIVETGTIERHNIRDGHKDVVVRDHNDYRQRVDRRTTVDDSDPMRKVTTNATVDKVDHYRTVDERQIVERLEKKAPSLERSRHQLKQIEAPEKPPRGSKSKKALASIGDKLRARREKDQDSTLRREIKDTDAVYTKVKKTSKVRSSESGKKWARDHSSDDDHDPNYAEVRYQDKETSKEPGRYRDLTKTRHASGEEISDDEVRRTNQMKTERRSLTKLYHDPVEANIEKNSANGWVTRKKETFVTSNTGANSSSPSPPLHKRPGTIERTKNVQKVQIGKHDTEREMERADKRSVSRTTSSATDKKDDTTFHHYKQYKGRHGPTYPSIRITLPGKENGEISDGQTTTRSNKFQRGKLPGNMQIRNGSVDRLDVPSNNGYHSSTLQHNKRNKSGGNIVKRSSSSAAGVPPVQRLRNNSQQRGISPMRTKNNTSSSADSIAGESTTSSRRAVGFYIPTVNHEHRKSLDDLGSSNRESNSRAASVARSHSVLSGAGSTKSGLKKYREKKTTYALAQPHGDPVDKDDEIYGSTHVIDYSKIDEEAEPNNNKVKKNNKNSKVKRTTSLPKDTRFPWLFRKKKKEKTMAVVKE